MADSYREAFLAQIRDSADTIVALADDVDVITAMAGAVVDCLNAGGKVLTAGNGGSAAAALHMAEELTGRFRADRMALPAVALPADTTALTCIANDFGFDAVFSRQIEALGRPGDVVVLFSSSGNSPNLVAAADAAEARDLALLCLLGRDGGRLAGRTPLEIIVRTQANERAQEAHELVMHLILDAVEKAFPPTS